MGLTEFRHSPLPLPLPLPLSQPLPPIPSRSVLFPLAALAYCLVVLAGRVVLKETVSGRRWLGTLVITLGVMLVAIAGNQA